MTRAPHAPVTDAGPFLGRSVIALRWTGLVPVPDARANGAILETRAFELVLRDAEIDLAAGQGRARLDAIVEDGAGRRVLADGRDVAFDLVVRDRVMHLDVEAEDGERLAAISIDAGGTVLYARTDLLAAAGIEPGGSDPPVLRG